MRVTVTRTGVAVVAARGASVAVRAVGGGGTVSVTVRGTQGASGTAALEAHVADTTDAHAASAIGLAEVAGLASTNVQAAIGELASRGGVGRADVVNSLAFAADQG